MAATTETTTRMARPPFWRDVKVLRVLAQVVAGVGAVGFLFYLGSNLQTNLTAQGITTDFDFLSQPAGVTVPGTDFSSTQPISDILVLGIKNTFALVIVGIPLLTILGTLIGIGRLSSNWLVRKAATAYVETLRNIPPLLVIIFTNTAVILASLPRIQEAWQPLDLFVFSNRGLVFPWFTAEDGSGAYLVVLAAGVVGSILAWIWRTRQFDATGTPHHRFLWGTGVFLLFAVIGFFVIGSPFSLSLPVLDGLVVTGGVTRISGYVAVLLALVIYTASHVAEIVRGSIQAVAKGQTEAANALALSSFQRLRFVVLPQAFRIAIPPLINQFLNFTKNSSLALAIGYSEITLVVFQAIGNGQPAPQLILILMGAYLLFSLSISLLINILNRRLQLVTN